MKTEFFVLARKQARIIALCGVIGLLLGSAADRCVAQAPAVNLPPGVQDVLKLERAGISDEVILAQIKSTRASYHLTADEILYLSGQGVSQPVIKALLSGNTDTVPASPPAAPAVPAVNNPVANNPSATPAYAPMPAAAPAPAYSAATQPSPVPAAGTADFQSQLAPYGAWIQVPGYGLCWQPSVAVADPSWRPYFNQGHWVYSDNGWFWQSDYPWGGVAFHYGRWTQANVGWIWVPGYDWAPAWVCWRQADGYCGWAPLPPAAVYRTGVGLTFEGRLALDVDFGLGAGAFVFVGYDHFWDRDLHPFLLPRERIGGIFRESRVMNSYRVDHGRFMVEGLGREHMAALTHREVRAEEVARDSGLRGRGDADRRDNRDDRRDHR